MRFKQYLNENSNITSIQDFISVALKDCGPFLKESRGLPLFRGMRTIRNPVTFIEHPKDRKPRDSEPEFNWAFNAMIDIALGIPEIRKKSIFITGSKEIAEDYGQAYFVFIKGDLHYLWSPQIIDSYDQADRIYTKINDAITRFTKMNLSILHSILDMLAKKISIRDWIRNTDSAGKMATKEITKDIYAIRNEDIYGPMVAAFSKTGKELYVEDGLDSAAIKEHEIFVYESEGYYLVSIESTREYLHSIGISVSRDANEIHEKLIRTIYANKN